MDGRLHRVTWWSGFAVATLLAVSACSQTSGRPSSMAAAGNGVTLTGAQEVPPVTTSASGVSTIEFLNDKVVTGAVKTSHINATAAHIHMAPTGQNGPVIITLVKSGENGWVVPGNTELSSAQLDALRAGNLYVNVHSAAHPSGEIRAQLKP
jgi:hypothetical protein